MTCLELMQMEMISTIVHRHPGASRLMEEQQTWHVVRAGEVCM
jgi:hypothetical protein